MAIIRNDRDRRASYGSSPDEVELDPTWYPTEDEFVSPITEEQWLEVIRDPSFAKTDAAMGLRRLYDYGEPCTFQQMSIRYNSTMGKHRRWLSDAAQFAGERYGVPAPQKDQFGTDEWWPLLYRVRAAGKPGAGVYEMQLRPEVERAFQIIEEDKLQEKRAEEVRKQQRQEKMDKALKAEQERKAAEAAAAAAARARNTDARNERAASSGSAATTTPVAPTPATAAAPAAVQVPLPYADEPAVPGAAPALAALDGFLALVDGEDEMHIVSAGGSNDSFDAAGPIDYTLRYAERLRGMLSLIRVGYPAVSAAHVARATGDESVEYLQSVLNGQRLPGFSYIDKIERQLFVNHEYLEAPDGAEDTVPAFVTYAELRKAHPTMPSLREDLPIQIAYVVDDTREGRTGVILRFSAVRCVLLTRVAVKSKSRRVKNEKLDAFLRMVDELDELARANGIVRTNYNVDAATWDDLAAGIVWPGSVLD